MTYIAKIQTQYIIIVLWVSYILYLALFDILLLIPKESIELITPMALQVLVSLLFEKLCKEKYYALIKITMTICSILVILWHFNLFYSISSNIETKLFMLTPVVSAAAYYLINKLRQIKKINIIKSFGLACLLTFINVIIAVFTFYFLHYLI
jgi:hypothetical protein